MCLRPDVVFVTNQSVYDDYLQLGEQGLFGCSRGYHDHCDQAIAAATAKGASHEIAHWRNVKDFGHRADCSPLGGVEIEGTLHRLEGIPACPPEALIRVYIGNPYNPPHEHQQPAITQERMAIINARYLAEQASKKMSEAP